jgi:UDP-2,3-diacylglucosamine pyrophosphatase LpxH
MIKAKKRYVELLVISDVHLGTYGCHAKELVQYLKSVNPETVILNGDIIDIWQFSKQYWPKSHMKVIKQIMRWASKGVKIYYVTGNHDEMLRKFVGFKMGNMQIVNKVILELSTGEKAWFFHGDVFDITMQHSKWLAKLGAVGYDTLIHINSFANFISEKLLHKGKISLSKRIKNSVKSAVKFVNNFEQIAADIGISNRYDYVVCGHIHQPAMKEINNDQGQITYLNSGDWVENLTALEFNEGKWSIYQYEESEFIELDEDEIELDNDQLFNELVEEFNLLKQ